MQSPNEPIETLNNRLRSHYGIGDNGGSNFRLSWSEDQFEHRYGTVYKFDDSGNKIGEETGIQWLPKYKQWMPNQWVLEWLTPVEGTKELTTKLSYEPLFGFRGLPPDWEVIKIIIDTLFEQLGRNKVVHKMPEMEQQTKEAQLARIEKLEKYLAEDSNNIANSLHHREAVINPGVKAL